MKNIQINTKEQLTYPYIITILKGKEPIPSNMYVGPECKYKHGLNGMSVKYILSKRCVLCERESGKKTRRKTYKNKALRIASIEKPYNWIDDLEEGLEE